MIGDALRDVLTTNIKMYVLKLYLVTLNFVMVCLVGENGMKWVKILETNRDRKKV